MFTFCNKYPHFHFKFISEKISKRKGFSERICQREHRVIIFTLFYTALFCQICWCCSHLIVTDIEAEYTSTQPRHSAANSVLGVNPPNFVCRHKKLKDGSLARESSVSISKWE